MTAKIEKTQNLFKKLDSGFKFLFRYPLYHDLLKSEIPRLYQAHQNQAELIGRFVDQTSDYFLADLLIARRVGEDLAFFGQTPLLFDNVFYTNFLKNYHQQAGSKRISGNQLIHNLYWHCARKTEKNIPLTVDDLRTAAAIGYLTENLQWIEKGINPVTDSPYSPHYHPHLF